MADENGSRIDRLERYLAQLPHYTQEGFARHNEAFAPHETMFRQIEETQLRTAEAQLKLAEAQNATEAKLSELHEAQKVTEQKMQETSEKLDALIKIVDEWIRNRPSAPNQ